MPILLNPIHSTMNTIQKGDAFEEEVFQTLQQLLLNNELAWQSESCEIFHKKSYYSDARKSDIIIDISIEIRHPGTSDICQYVFVECKDYTGNIPVNDLEEFDSKVEQISGRNVKAIFATRSALQSSALNYARSKGIGVVRIIPEDQVEWVLHHMSSTSIHGERLSPREFNRAMTEDRFRSRNRDFYATDGAYIYSNWRALLNKIPNLLT